MRARWLVTVALVASASPLAAQRAADSAQRPAVQQLQRRLLEVVQRTLGASDAQMRQLVAVNHRYEAERRTLNQKDREARQSIRAEVLRDSLANQEQVARMLEVLVDVQRQRLDVFAREQKDLAGFLTPVQRAKYATLQDRLRKKVEQLRQDRQEQGLAPAQRRRLRALRRMGDTTG